MLIKRKRGILESMDLHTILNNSVSFWTQCENTLSVILNVAKRSEESRKRTPEALPYPVGLKRATVSLFRLCKNGEYLIVRKSLQILSR